MNAASETGCEGYLEVLDRTGNVTDRLAVTELPVSVGRGYDNDLVVADPYVCARHLKITLDEAGRVVAEDLDSVNGTFAPGSKQRQRQCALDNGEPIRFGHSRLRYRALSYQVEPTLADHRRRNTLGLFESPVARGVIFAIAFLTLWISGHLDSVDRRESAEVIFDLIGPIGVVIAWAAVWAFAGRVMSQRIKFLSHCAIVSSAIVAVTVLDPAIEYLAFSFNIDEFRTGLSALMALTVLSAMLYSHLRFTTFAPPTRLGIVSTAIAVAVIGLVSLKAEIAADEFAANPRYEGTLKAPIYKLAKTRLSDDFFTDLETLHKQVRDSVESSES